MKFLIPLLSLSILSPQIALAAPVTTAPLTAKPRAGEVALTGSIESLDVIQNRLTLRATGFAVASGATKKLPQAKIKAIQLGDATQFLESSGIKNLSLGDLEKGVNIRVVGREVAGKPFAARLITWRAPAPELALDPLTPRVKAPFLPAPQTQNGITLRVIDAGWMSLSQMWPWENSRRPLFYFSYNLPGESDGKPDGAGWMTSVAARNTKLLRVSGPNGEPVSVVSTGMVEREGGGYGATRAALGGVNPAWKHVVAEWETLDPAAPADASGEFSSVLAFDKVAVPPQNGEKLEIGQEKTTKLGSKIRLQTVRLEKSANNGKGRTTLNFVITPPANVADMKVNLDLDKMRDEAESAWNYNSWGSGGSEVHVDAMPNPTDKFMVPSIKINEKAPSLRKANFYRRFRVEVPVASFLRFAAPQSGALAPVLAEGKAFTVQIEPGNARDTGTWDGVAWIKNRAGGGGDKSERWIVREVKSRAGGQEAGGSSSESEYNRQFMHISGKPATSDEHSNNLALFFNQRPDKFDLEMKVEKANRLENFDWLRGVPLPAAGQSLDMRDGQFETDHIRIKRVFRFQNVSELAGLSPNAREAFGGSNLAIVLDVSPVFPGARVEIPSFRVQDQTGRQLEVMNWMPSGDAGRANTENTKLRTLIFALPPSSKSLDLWFNSVETAWSGQSETVTIKDVAGKG